MNKHRAVAIRPRYTIPPTALAGNSAGKEPSANTKIQAKIAKLEAKGSDLTKAQKKELKELKNQLKEEEKILESVAEGRGMAVARAERR